MKPSKFLSMTESIDAAWKKSLSHINEMGFEYCIYPHVRSNGESIGAIVTENTIAWNVYHLSQNYYKFDPVAKSALNKKVCIWNLLDEIDNNARKVMNERREYGMKAGITIPFINRYGHRTSWFSMSTQNSQQYLNSIMNTPDFYNNVYDIHTKMLSYTLSEKTGLDFDICYAITLSQYINNVNDISEKTGFSVDCLYKLFGKLYLFSNHIELCSLEIKADTLTGLTNLVTSLQHASCLKYKFSRRQLDCIQLIKKGLPVKIAAKELGISPRTYEGYANEIRKKLNCNTQKELMFILGKYAI